MGDDEDLKYLQKKRSTQISVVVGSRPSTCGTTIALLQTTICSFNKTIVREHLYSLTCDFATYSSLKAEEIHELNTTN